MSPTTANHNGDSQLETGLLSTREEEKIPCITPGSYQAKSSSAVCPSGTQRRSGKMSPFRRATLILTFSLLLGLGLTLARSSSLTPSCMTWAHSRHQGSFNIARAAVNKRQDGSATNATTPRSSIDQSKTSANSEQSTPPVVVSSSTLPLPVVPTTSKPATPSSPPPQATPTSASTTPQQPALPPSSSITSTTIQAPPTPLPIATTPGQIETSTPSNNPESSATTTPDSVPTTTPFEKTITTGRVITSSPVPRIFTTVLPNGGILTITSTSWVAIVPTDRPTSSSEPKLQNAAPKSLGSSRLVTAVGAAALCILLY
ncbi:hypothetical protein E4U21_003595 [Claviceps maximensis]|nr:hypothetical protein E4U21_003595 [Claviceps maximensis]